jgi:hypothetical protein
MRSAGMRHSAASRVDLRPLRFDELELARKGECEQPKRDFRFRPAGVAVDCDQECGQLFLRQRRALLRWRNDNSASDFTRRVYLRQQVLNRVLENLRDDLPGVFG